MEAALATRPAASTSAVALSAHGLVKSFAGRRALDEVGIEIRRGEIHALLGANGSGKSTLVKVLTGVYRPDAGVIAIGGRSFSAITSPHEANALGIAVVHQEAPLIDTFTVAECIAQFRGYPTRGGWIRWRQLHREVADLLEQFGVGVDPHEPAGRLSAAERALVAIIIALDRVKSGLQLLVLDEVTASLPRNQAEPYLERVAALAKTGIAVLMVTHRLAELHGRASALTLLRDGKVVLSGPAADVADDQLVAEMVGSATPVGTPAGTHGARGVLRNLWSVRGRDERRAAVRNGSALEVSDLSGMRLNHLSFSVARGEIVGIAGLSEAGVNELPLMLSGILRPRSGRLSVAGQGLPRTATPRDVIRAGMAVLPSDRLQSGGIATLSLADNATLPDLTRYWHRGDRLRKVLLSLIDGFDVRPPLPGSLFGKLSGGNQQKTILGKWLLMHPAVLVLDDPTSGVDPAARRKIFELLREAAAEGVGVLVFSTEPEPLAGICSRVLILREGAIVHELRGTELSPQTVSQWCYA